MRATGVLGLALLAGLAGCSPATQGSSSGMVAADGSDGADGSGAESAEPAVAEQLWELPGLETPESVVYDAEEDCLYLSLIKGVFDEKDGNGYIAKISLDGEIIEPMFVGGLHSPKGLVLDGRTLYTSDIDEIVQIDLATRAVTRYPAQGASSLNDPAVGPDGTVYVTDFFGQRIYQLRGGAVSVLLETDALDSPNGLLYDDGALYVASWGIITDPQTFGTDVPGKVLRVDLDDLSISDVTSPFGNLDGIEPRGSSLYVADWAEGGRLTEITAEGEVRTIIDDLGGPADHEYIEDTNTVIIPIQIDDTSSKLVAYRLAR